MNLLEKRNRNWLIYKLRYADHATYGDIRVRLVQRGYPELDESQISRVARKMKAEADKAKGVSE